MMKKLALILSIVVFASWTNPLQEDANRIYNYLEANHEVFSLSLSKTMIDAFDLDIDLQGKEKLVTGDFTKGKLLIVQDHKPTSIVLKMFMDEKFEQINIDEELDDEDDGNSEVYLFAKRIKSKYREVHFVVENDENLILLSIYGDMNVTEKH